MVSAATREAQSVPVCTSVPGVSWANAGPSASGGLAPVQRAEITAGSGRPIWAGSAPSQGEIRALTLWALITCGSATSGMAFSAFITASRRVPLLAASGACGCGTWIVSSAAASPCQRAARVALASAPAMAKAARKLTAATSTGSSMSPSASRRPR